MNGKSILKGAVIVATALLCVSTSRVYADATINLAADDLVYFGLSSGQALPAGDAVYMGRFSITDGAISALVSGGHVSAANYTTLVSDFLPLNTTSLNTIGGPSVSGSDGAINAAWTGNNGAFASQGIYLMVVDTATTAGAGQVGVFQGSDWIYPADMVGGSLSIDTDTALSTPLIGSYAVGLDSVANGYAWDMIAGGFYGSINALELATVDAVPEPSAYALVGMGLIGMIGLIRRRRQS